MEYFLSVVVALTPTYAIRFSLFGVPTNLLMAGVFTFWLAALFFLSVGRRWGDFFFFIRTFDKKLLVLTGMFFLSGLLALFANGIDQKKLGQFLVLFLQPISIFFLAGFLISIKPQTKNLIRDTVYILVSIAGVVAAVQFFTLLGLPPQYWGNSVEPKRALSFFTHPNFYALFVTPLLSLLLPDFVEQTKTLRSGWALARFIAWLVGCFGLLLSMSRAGWLGLLAATFLYLVFAANKKARLWGLVTIVVVFLTLFSVTNLRYRIILPLLGEKSAISRLSLWRTGWKAIQEAPFTGLGLGGFAKNWKSLNTDPNLETHNYPHNILLNFWVETGPLGMTTFVLLSFFLFLRGIKNKRNAFNFGTGLFLAALFTQGLIDNPYLKNDLALLFWIAAALTL